MTLIDSDLDTSQRTVVSLPVDAHQIVTAGPGAGKTEVVSRLAARFVRDGVYPNEVLVISFSRAAVLATDRRTQHIVEEGNGVDLTTIDALAARIVLANHHEQELRGFDDTVSRATAELTKSGWSLEPVAHVIVDEVQDVVGLRARFVLRLLEELVNQGAGFTILGDPMQAVYDFQLGHDSMTSDHLLAAVRAAFGPQEHLLTGEHRTRSDQTRAAASERPALAAMQPEERMRALGAIAVDVPPLGGVDADTMHDIAAWHGSTALLTDTNIRAALLGQEARWLGYDVSVIPSGDDSGLPAWIADLLQHYPGASLSRKQFLDLDHGGLECGTDRWRALLEASHGRRDLQLRDLGLALQGVGRMRQLERSPTDATSVSTVHRAKGLEFDNVVLVDPLDWDVRNDAASDAGSRRLFVALTRARNQISRIRGIETRGWSRPTVAGTPVWVKRQPRRGGSGRVTAVLIEPWMARALGPVPAGLDGTVGRRLAWRRTEEHITVDGNPLPSWIAFAEDTPVARTGEGFGEIIAELTDPTLLRLPDLHGGYVERLETVAGPATSAAGPGRHGFWTGARVAGGLSFVWN